MKNIVGQRLTQLLDCSPYYVYSRVPHAYPSTRAILVESTNGDTSYDNNTIHEIIFPCQTF